MRSVALLLLVLAVDAHDAAACGASLSEPLTLDPAHIDDAVAPSPPVVSATARRSIGTDCGDHVFVTMHVSSMDDRAPSERLGYLVDMDGTAMTAPTGSIVLAFPADSPSFTKQFSVRAVDLNGNTSESTLVDVTYEAPPDEGCNVGASASPAPMLLALALCTLGRRRRRVA